MFLFAQRKRRESASSSSSIKKVKKPWHKWLCKLNWTFLVEEREMSGSLMWLPVLVRVRGWGCGCRSSVICCFDDRSLSLLMYSAQWPPSLNPTCFPPLSVLHTKPVPWHRPPLTTYSIIPPPVSNRQPKPRWTVNWQRELIGTWQEQK